MLRFDFKKDFISFMNCLNMIWVISHDAFCSIIDCLWYLLVYGIICGEYDISDWGFILFIFPSRPYGAPPVNLNIKTTGSRPYGQGMPLSLNLLLFSFAFFNKMNVI